MRKALVKKLHDTLMKGSSKLPQSITLTSEELRELCKQINATDRLLYRAYSPVDQFQASRNLEAALTGGY